MKDDLTRTLARWRRTFDLFTTGQKVVAIVGTAAVLLAGFLVFRWAATPSYAPLFSNLSSEDASAVIDELEAQGVAYEITNGGSTVMVPRKDVYPTRIQLSGEGLPSSTDAGYSLLDGQDLSTSEFKEQTDFKRAMEGELASTIEAIDGVDTAVVHLALPEKEVFAEEQDPPTASVLVKTAPGSTFDQEQVQAVVHLVASSIDGLDPADVTIADATGRVLSVPGDSPGGAASTRTQQVSEFQDQMRSRIQDVLDEVVGPGNSTANVTADLDFDKSVTETRSFTATPGVPPLSESRNKEIYNGPASGANGVGGVVGPDGQMEPGAGAAGGNSSYQNTQTTADNAVDSRVERRETAPGSVNSIHIGVVLDSAAAGVIQPEDVQAVIAAAVGIDTGRGDTIQVTKMPFDRSSEEAAAKELEAAADAEASASRMAMFRNAGLVVMVALLVLLAWLRARRKSRAREDATTYIVEQLRQEQAERAAAEELERSPALAALDHAERTEADELRDELDALVERQPEDVASLLRGWLVERS